MGDVDARAHIVRATALGRGRVASPMLAHLLIIIIIIINLVEFLKLYNLVV